MKLDMSMTDHEHEGHSKPTRPSFAGALKRAMRRERPPLTADDVSLLTRELTEADVEDLLCARRLPTAHEVTLVADSLGMTLDELLGFQRATLSPSPGNGPSRDSQPQEMVAIKVMVTPEARTALRLRKATTATDSGDLIRSLIDSELTAEIDLIRERSEGCHAGRCL